MWVTITDVKASTNADASNGDSSFVDLTPSLSSAPKQIDLLGLAGNNCLLASLGDPLQLQAGTYQQIRLYLAPNSATIANNACSGAANCVVLNDGSTHTLQLSSEAQTGIKISSGQISSQGSAGSGNGFTIAAGQTKDLNIDFNTCISIVTEGNGQYRLKPVLHAGEVSTTSSSINGTVVDSVTGKAVAGPVMVALEQKDSAGIDRVYMTTMTDSTGAFVFCPLPSGSYDLVIVGTTTAGASYSPTVVTGVSPGQTLATVQLYAQSSASTTTSTAATPLTLNGTITSASAATTAAATAVDLQVSFLETVTGNLVVTVPVLPTAAQSSAVLSLATTALSTCAVGTDCVSYSAVLSNGTPYVGAYAASGATLALSSVAAAYKVDAIAFNTTAVGTLDCSVSDLTSTAIPLGTTTTATASTLAFVGCQ